MSWICQGLPANFNKNTQTIVISEYRRIDPKTKQIFVQYLDDDHNGDMKKYQEWRRTKMESIDSRGLIRTLKESSNHFIDPHFPHQNSVLSKDFFHGDIEWLRVRDVIQNAVYSKEQTNKTLQKIKLNRKQFQKALILIARSSPSMFKQLLSKTLNSEGVYEYKLFHNGYIRNVVIDDYIPTHSGSPIFVGPARDNQVYPILLQKAIAKVCGSYEQIPEDAELIMQMIFCGPVHTNNVMDLRDKSKLNSTLKDCMQKKGLTVLLSKKDPKIRNYGLNDNQAYHVVNYHQVEVKEGKEDVFELVSQSKISAWNGKFALNDAIWGEIAQNRKNELYLQLKNNHSFLMADKDVGKHFQELLIFQSMDINNKDWIQNNSQNGFPSFTKFQLTQKERIFLRVSTSYKIRQTVLLVKQTGIKKYQYVHSTFDQNNTKSQISIILQPGKYILCVYHEWFLEKTGKYFVFLSSMKHVLLERGGVIDKDFLVKALLSYQNQLDTQKDNKIYKIRMQLQKFGLAYLVLNPSNSKNRSIKIQIDQQKLLQDGWQIQQPYLNINVVTVTEKNQQQQSLIILLKKDIDFSKKNHFPAAAFKLKE